MLQQQEVLGRLKDAGDREVFNGEHIGDLDLHGQDLDVCLNLAGAQLGGCVDLSYAKLRKGFRAPYAFFGGPLRAQHCEICGDVILSNSSFANTVDFSWTQVRGIFWAWRARFRADATFFQLVCAPGEERNTGFVYSGELNFSWSWFYGKALFERGRFEGPVYFWRTRFFDNCSFNESSFSRDATFMGKVSEICLQRYEIGSEFCTKLESAGLLRPGGEGSTFIDEREVPLYFHLLNVNSLQELGARMNEAGLSNEDQSLLAEQYYRHAGPMFAKEASLQRMRFEQPRQIKFIGVNASEWSLAGTDIDAISFFNANEEPVPRVVGLGHVYDTVFISYGGPDEPVARRFHEALQRSGVSAYFYKEDAVPGRLIDDEMLTRIGNCARVLLICSRSAPKRPGWRFELDRAFKREETEGVGKVLLPVAVDDALWTKWSPEIDRLRQGLVSRNVADFRGALDNLDQFNERLSRLLEALRRQEV